MLQYGLPLFPLLITRVAVAGTLAGAASINQKPLLRRGDVRVKCVTV